MWTRIAQSVPFAQPRPAPLVFKLADHLQQLVAVVVDPARTRTREDGARGTPISGQGSDRGLARNSRPGLGSSLSAVSRPMPRMGPDFRGETGLGVDESCAGRPVAGSTRPVPWARSLRLALGWWAFAAKETPENTLTLLAGSLFESFCLFSHPWHFLTKSQLKVVVRNTTEGETS